jgi:hypothetical protein
VQELAWKLCADRKSHCDWLALSSTPSTSSFRLSQSRFDIMVANFIKSGVVLIMACCVVLDALVVMTDLGGGYHNK